MKSEHSSFDRSYLILYERILLDRWHGHFNVLNAVTKDLHAVRKELDERKTGN